MFDFVTYLKYAVDNHYLDDMKWYVDFIMYIQDENYQDEYISKNGKEIKINIDGDWIIFTDNYSGPIIDIYYEFDLPKGFISNINKDIKKTTFGLFMANYLLLAIVFGAKVPYNNNEFSVTDIENNYILKLLTGDPNDLSGISINELTAFVENVKFLTDVTENITISTTERAMLPPTGIDEFVKDLVDNIVKEKGESALNDLTVIAEIDKKVKAYDDEYLKGDPSLGKLTSGKTKDIARKKMFLSYGANERFDPNAPSRGIIRSLDKGWGKDPEDLAALFNDSRKGSIERGMETQHGGVAAKINLRSTNDIEIKDEDCGSTTYRRKYITDENYKSLIGRYINTDKGLLQIKDPEEAKTYIGKLVDQRSPIGCKLKHHYCKICTGGGLENYKNAIALMVIEAAGMMVKESLKSMHGKELTVVPFSLDEIV